MSRLLGKTRSALEVSKSWEAFTIVELTIVIILSVIMMAGMVALVSQSFTLFDRSKDLQALNDSSRRTLGSISRQLKGALRIDDSHTSQAMLGFYADIDYDNPTATSEPAHYQEAERVIFYRDANTNTVKQHTNEPGSPLTEPDAGTDPTLGNYCTALDFYYFAPGDVPAGNPPFTNDITGTNESIGSVVVVMSLGKGRVTRQYQQQIFLRVLTRE